MAARGSLLTEVHLRPYTSHGCAWSRIQAIVNPVNTVIRYGFTHHRNYFCVLSVNRLPVADSTGSRTDGCRVGIKLLGTEEQRFSGALSCADVRSVTD